MSTSSEEDKSKSKIIRLKDMAISSSAPIIRVSEDVKKPKRSKSEKKISKPSLMKDNSKVGKIFGDDMVIDVEHPQFAPQPRHIRYFKLKKLFGQDIALEYAESPSDTLIYSEENSDFIKEKRNIDKSRRVQKFFGQKFDVNEAIYNARMNHEDNSNNDVPSVFIQPSYINIIKLHRFFGMRPNIQRRDKKDIIEFYKRRNSEYSLLNKEMDNSSDKENISNSVDDDLLEKKKSKPVLVKCESSDSLVESIRGIKPMNLKGYSSDNDEVYSIWEEEKKELHTKRKLRSIFGVTVDLKDCNYRLYAPQPHNVKTYKLKKIFGSDVIVEHIDMPNKEKSEKWNKKEMKKFTEKRKSRKIKSFFGNDYFSPKSKDTQNKSSKKKKKKKRIGK